MVVRGQKGVLLYSRTKVFFQGEGLVNPVAKVAQVRPTCDVVGNIVPTRSHHAGEVVTSINKINNDFVSGDLRQKASATSFTRLVITPSGVSRTFH